MNIVLWDIWLSFPRAVSGLCRQGIHIALYRERERASTRAPTGERLLWDCSSLSRFTGPHRGSHWQGEGADLTHLQKPPYLGDVSTAGSEITLALPSPNPRGIQPG